MIDVRVVGSDEKPLKINGEGELTVAIHTHPPTDEVVESYPFSSYFENSGSNDMRVNGSTSSVFFKISALTDKHVFVKTISVQISDTGATLNKFGNLAALANGVSFVYNTPQTGEIIIQDEIKTNLDFLRLGQTTAGVGGGTDAFKADISGGGADTYLPVIDLAQTFGFPYGLHLRKGENARLGFYVNDNLSVGLDTFNIKAFGVQV